MSQSELDVFSDMIALQHGIIHPTVSRMRSTECERSIDAALMSMSAEEARDCRRKFRKLLRKCNSRKSLQRMGSWQKRISVNLHIQAQAWSLIRDINPVDNDE